PRGTCVVATVPGEGHGLPAVMAAVCLRADRWRVHHLGAEVPLDDLVDLAARTHADVVVLSSTRPVGDRGIAGAATSVRRAGHRVLTGHAGARLRDLLAAARARTAGDGRTSRG